jgi:TonB family protein
VPNSRSEASFVAVGTAGAVLDSLEAELRTREHLALRRDSAGGASLTVLDTFPGQVNEAVVHVAEAGGGRVRGTVQSRYRMVRPLVGGGTDAFRNLSLLPVEALTARNVPVLVLPVPEPGVAPCTTAEAWDGAPARPAPPARDLVPDETVPVLIGGLDAFARDIDYPAAALRDGVEGRTLVQFVVDATGAVTCAELVVGLRADLNAEALRAVRATRWVAGTQGGRPVKVRFTLPMTFRVG